MFRKAFRPKNVSPKQWNPTPASLAQWGETNVDAMPAATRAFANQATEAGKFASWNKPFASYAQEDPPSTPTSTVAPEEPPAPVLDGEPMHPYP